ncbi:hypothetical protein ACXFAU_29295 (plasmid) [Paenibacillus glucanolyticus]
MRLDRYEFLFRYNYRPFLANLLAQAAGYTASFKRLPVSLERPVASRHSSTDVTW